MEEQKNTNMSRDIPQDSAASPQDLARRQQQFLQEIAQMRTQLARKYGPGSEDKMREALMMKIKEVLARLGIVPGQPGADEAAQNFIAGLPQEILDILDSRASENKLSSMLNKRMQGDSSMTNTEPEEPAGTPLI